jgi:hypothetical protein
MRLRDLIRAAENKYNRLLTLLVLIYLSSPFLADWAIGNVILFFLFLGTIVIVVHQIQHSKKLLRLHIGLIALAMVLRVLTYSTSALPHFNQVFEVLSTSILMAFFALSIYLILRELAIAEQVTADMIKGGICVYFLLGFFWVALYDIVYSFDANSFTAASKTISRSDLAHFSFTTLTTVGYGDISPASEIARVLSNLQGMVGVMYPAIFIARLVGLYQK